MGSKAFESPLISHMRMRALYRGLIEVRALLGRRHPAHGMEAGWVSTAIDLAEGDLTSDAGSPQEAALLTYIRSVGARPGGSAARSTDLRRLRKQIAETEVERFPGSEADRLICSAGAAMALKAAGEQKVVLAYSAGHVTRANDWRRVLMVMSQAALPMVLLAMPGGVACDLDALARKAAAAPDRVVPVIPVDGGDVVALYRVAQETIGRARAGGGSAIIAAIDLKTDPVKLLGSQLIKKRICTERWVSEVEVNFRTLLT